MLKALVRVFFFSKDGRDVPVMGGDYSPHLIIKGGNGDKLGVDFTDKILFDFDKSHVSEVVCIYDNVDYSQIVVNAEFDVLEGSKVVATGHVIATNRKEK